MFFDRIDARRARGAAPSGGLVSNDTEPPPMLWLAYREDERGNRFLVAVHLVGEDVPTL